MHENLIKIIIRVNIFKAGGHPTKTRQLSLNLSKTLFSGSNQYIYHAYTVVYKEYNGRYLFYSRW